MENPRYPGLQLDEDMKLQKREWLVQRVAWALLYALLAAIALGLLGNGPLSRSSLKIQDGSLAVEYERFMRYRSPETLRLTAIPVSGLLKLQIAGDYIGRIEIKKVVPEPEFVIPGADAMTFVFRAESAKPQKIALHIQSERIGVLDGWIALEGKSRLALRQFVYP